MTQWVDHIRGQSFHTRKGRIRNAFRYGVDYVLFDPESWQGPALLRRQGFGAMSLDASDWGGAPGQGQGARWARAALARHDIRPQRLALLTQPRVLGHSFNPVSFWFAFDAADNLIAAIAEVTNTFGDRHCYLCAPASGRAITPHDTLEAQKLLHVSPFQPVAGGYRFRFDIGPDRIGVWIDYSHAEGGVVATLTGRRARLTNAAIVAAMLRRPFGARRVLALIHLQALVLWAKRARYRQRPPAPAQDVSGPVAK